MGRCCWPLGPGEGRLVKDVLRTMLYIADVTATGSRDLKGAQMTRAALVGSGLSCIDLCRIRMSLGSAVAQR